MEGRGVKRVWVWALWACMFLGIPAGGLAQAEEGDPVPRGALQELIVEHQGQIYTFGPFVGYFFWPRKPGEVHKLRFVCMNDNQFYTKDMQAGALLFQGEAVFTCLPQNAVPRSAPGERMKPVFARDIPETWLSTRPEPSAEYRHFHSAHNAQGAVSCGYWMRHRSEHFFTYDMGGRVGPKSPLYHRVQPGVDTEFPLIVEFDHGR